jgi:hypothetical protein
MNGIGRRSTPGGGTVGQCTRDSNRDIARQCETVRYSPTGNPGEYAPYQARFLHRPEKVARSDAPPTPGEPNHNEPYRKPRTGAYRRIAAYSRYVMPCHRGTMRDGRQVAPEANQCEPYRNTEPTKSDEAGPATYRNIPGTPPPEYAAYYP